MTDFIDAMAAALTGVTVVTTAGPIGRTVSAMCSVSADPPLLLVSIRSDSPLVAAIRLRGAFAVNVLAADQAALADGFARGSHDWSAFSGPLPLLRDAAASFECEVERCSVAGTHTLILGAVVRARRGSAPALGYTRQGYLAA